MQGRQSEDTISATPPSFPLTDEEKRPFIQRLFTQIAPRYDWFNRLASCGFDGHWRRLAIAQGGIIPGMRILDVCAGTGDLALRCARVQRGEGTVVGVDMNASMLAYARTKQRAQGLGGTWLLGDAEALPHAEGTFDRVLIGFSTRNLTNLSIGLREMIRVLRPGGLLIILETGRPANPIVRFGHQLYLFTVARAIGWCLTGRLWPFTYLATSVRQFVTPAQLVCRLEALGTEVRYRPLSQGLASLFLVTKAAPAQARHSATEAGYPAELGGRRKCREPRGSLPATLKVAASPGRQESGGRAEA